MNYKDINISNDGKEVKKSNPKDAMKNRLPIDEMKAPILAFCEEQKQIYISINNGSNFPYLEMADIRFYQGQFFLVLTPASIFLRKLEDGSKFTGFIPDKNVEGLKMTKRLYGKFICQVISLDYPTLQSLAEVDPMVKRMLTHGAKFFTLAQEELVMFFGGGQVYNLDGDFNPSFAPCEPNGKKRFEHSRHVLMEYQDRQVIFSSLVEGDTYYTLAKADSNKMAHIKAGGTCKFYDGRDNHFESQITIIPEEKVMEIYQKLVDTNNAFFKSPENLVALSYHK